MCGARLEECACLLSCGHQTSADALVWAVPLQGDAEDMVVALPEQSLPLRGLLNSTQNTKECHLQKLH